MAKTKAVHAQQCITWVGIVFERISVDSRIRYENGSVDANQSMRFRPYKNAYIWKRTSVDRA